MRPGPRRHPLPSSGRQGTAYDSDKGVNHLRFVESGCADQQLQQTVQPDDTDISKRRVDLVLTDQANDRSGVDTQDGVYPISSESQWLQIDPGLAAPERGAVETTSRIVLGVDYPDAGRTYDKVVNVASAVG